MNITQKIIITDTNIITDLSNANILDKFVSLDNVYISDLVKNDEINSDTGNKSIIDKFKTLSATQEQIIEMFEISKSNRSLSKYDALNYIISRDNNGILATGDQKLKDFSEQNGIEVIRTLRIIKLMVESKIISREEAITACTLLLNTESTRIPKGDLERIIKQYEEDMAVC